MLINRGVKKIWVSENYPDELSKTMLAEAGVEVLHLPHGADEACSACSETPRSGTATDENEGGRA